MMRWEYGDPFEIVARREAVAQRQDRACGQCMHKISLAWKGEVLHGCESKQRRYGVRCLLYRPANREAV